MAAPHVAGAIGLLYELKPDLPIETVRSLLQHSAADEVGAQNEDSPGWDMYMGWGRLELPTLFDAVLNQVLLECDQADRGTQMTCTVSNGEPGAKVKLGRGTSVGPGPCPPALNGDCLLITNPSLLAKGVADDDGVAVFKIDIDFSEGMGSKIPIQAGVLSTPPKLSYPVELIVR